MMRFMVYLKYSAHVDAKPHKDFNLWGKDFLRIQIPLKIPQEINVTSSLLKQEKDFIGRGKGRDI